MKRVMCLSVALSFLLAPRADATSVVALDEAGLVRSSSIIGVAQVLRTHTESSGRGVVTVAELQFYQGVKGVKLGDVVAVQIPGGPMGGGMVMRVSGAPELETGQLMLGFFHEHGGVLKPTAMSLGVMPIVIDASGEARVVQRTDGLVFVAPDGSQTASRVRVHNQPLDQVLERLRRLAEIPDEPELPGSGVQR